MSAVLAVADPVITGLATLAGAGVGGTIAGYVALKAEERHQSFTAHRDGEAAAAELRSAATLVWMELFEIDVALWSVNEGAPLEYPIATPRWDRHAETLTAGRLQDATVAALSGAYTFIATVNATVQERGPVDDVADPHDDVVTAKEALEAEGYGSPG